MTAAPKWIGDILSDRYQITANLGVGGMAYLYCALDFHLAMVVVIKVPRPELLSEVGFAERFNREIRSLVNLSHPRVVRILDVGCHENVPFCVMQYLHGESLEDRGRNYGLTTMRSWLPQMCEALDFVHAERYVHRDVKPGNILFDDSGNAYLSDFGIVKALVSTVLSGNSALTLTGMVIGTPDYMAPEVILGEPYNGRADQYSLAVIVHELLANGPPFQAATPAAVMVKHAHEAPPQLHTINPRIPESLSNSISRALAKNPNDRFANCREFGDALLRTDS